MCLQWALEPLLLKYGVDMWLGGHVHSYHRSWPSAGGKPTQRDYVGLLKQRLHRQHVVVLETFSERSLVHLQVNPTAPVHILDGVGGCSGLSAYHDLPPPWMAFSAPGKPNNAAYGQLKVRNVSHATWSSIHAVTREVIDEFTIVQRKHGEFPSPDSTGAGVSVKAISLCM